MKLLIINNYNYNSHEINNKVSKFEIIFFYSHNIGLLLNS